MPDTSLLIYVGTYANDDAEGIHLLRLGLSSGELLDLGLVARVCNPFFLAADSRRRTLFATVVCDEFEGAACGAVCSFSVDATSGALKELSRVSAKGTVPCYLSVTPDDRHVLVGNYGDGTLAVLPVDEDGILSEATSVVRHEGSSINTSRQEGPHVHSIVLSPDGRHAYAADLGIDRVMVYTLDASAGALVPAVPASVAAAPGAGPRHLKFNASGDRAYLINELDNTLVAYRRDAGTGALTEIQTVSAIPEGFSDETYCADIQVHPSGRFLYGSNRGHDSIACAGIDDSGRLSGVKHVASGGAWPWNLAVTPEGRFLLAANQRGDCVSLFSIDADSGDLTPTGQSVAVPKPVCLAIL